MPKKITPEERQKRIERLPAWAQKELASVQRELANVTRELNDHRLHAYGDPMSNTIADPYGAVPLNLKNGESIEFRLGPGHHEVIRVRVRDGVLDVNANGGLLVMPKASNHVDLKVSGH
ncbi:hypothetical protein SEA_CREWMATE_68 [Arthrobacter phage Crewmate]|uniref:Uncharacterized protein n=1 Tax=Arthrobacter phage Crewmate TaxID=2832317 RepID=A0AA48Y3Q0_9CAUD|nr:hypothetical protein PQE17_gp68 [Arthrobacter phage Crewmate]UIW13319.1 hypothetical protein SEA_CREWMATE_68 [Arthrobacter phage Crewmate]WGH21244.1 hypothetical protein SEA_OBITOO_68 [Arthrobacter phage ObiToo]